MEAYVHTAVVAVAWMIAMLSLILWLEKMIRIIMANYLIASILLWLWNFIDLITQRLLIWTVERWVDGLQIWIWKLLIAGKPTFLLTVYFVLLLFIVTKSQIGIWKVKHEAVKWVLTFIFLPCTIISIMLSIGLAIYGNQIMNVDELAMLAENVKSIPYVYNFVMLTPLWIILPWMVTILVAALVLRTKDDAKKEIVLDLWESSSE